MAYEQRKRGERRAKKRRRLLSEKEFRKLIDTGKTSEKDKRAWHERRKSKRRKKQMGI